ncbi:MAG: lactate utilization protein [Candidatus Coproplasma sp.]
MENLVKVKEKLEKRGYDCRIAASAQEALEDAVKIIGGGSVGFGGSVTLGQIGLPERLQQNGNQLFWHWKDGAKMRNLALGADFFVCSANAVTEDGEIIQTDGTGNRIAALCYGPENVIMIIGKNKIVRDRAEGERRIKSGICAGQNGKRLGLSTPCAVSGSCADCNSPQRMCSVTAVFERAPKGFNRAYVILVDENLGY